MKPPKITLGPWHLAGLPHDQYWFENINATGDHVALAKVYFPEIGKNRTPEAAYSEGCANARLIAAAPDLLEALDTALPVMRSYFEALGPCDHGVGICNCDMKTAITQVEAAIAKARGQS